MSSQNRAVLSWVLTCGLLAPAAHPAGAQGCRDTLAHLGPRLPQLSYPELAQLRAAILATNLVDAERQLAARGTPASEAIALARQQSAVYESTMRDSRQCAVSVFAGDGTALAAALDAHRYDTAIPGAHGRVTIAQMIDDTRDVGMLTSCLRAFAAADMGRIANDETAVQLGCRAGSSSAAGSGGGVRGGGGVGSAGLAGGAYQAATGATLGAGTGLDLRGSGTSNSSGGAWGMTPAQRQAAFTAGSQGASQPASFSEILNEMNRQLRQQQMAAATPEVARILAYQDAQQAQNEASLAATNAGFVQGRQAAVEGAMAEQVAMVQNVVKGWKPPRAYASSGSASAGTLADPFASAQSRGQGAEAAPAVPTEVLAGTGLGWDEVRSTARVVDAAVACGGRLRAGDYPVLPDGNLLDTAARVEAFLVHCAGPAVPIQVLLDSGTMEVRP
jgi:hypothetical protein